MGIFKDFASSGYGDFTVGALTGSVHGKIICMVGPPGVGKTKPNPIISFLYHSRGIDRL